MTFSRRSFVAGPAGLWGFLGHPGAFDVSADGVRDDTAAVQKALDAASATGATVALGPGRFRIEGSLRVPPGVCLEGVSRHPPVGAERGTILLARGGAGRADGTPLITLAEAAGVRGLTVFYPDQLRRNPPIAYPWTLSAAGPGCFVLDVLLVNPYQGVDLASAPSGRHHVEKLFGQPLLRGLAVDRCLDVGRLRDVHFWPFWDETDGALRRFTRENGVAFQFGRTDWQSVSGAFCLGYAVGFLFAATPAGEPNVTLDQCGSDLGPLAVRVESCQEHSGISFVNGQFMSGVEVLPGNRGPVKFTACGFWSTPETDSHLRLEGDAHVTLVGCHFREWARRTPGAPAIDALSGSLAINGCEFAAPGVPLRVSAAARASVVGSRFAGAAPIASERVLLSANIEGPGAP